MQPTLQEPVNLGMMVFPGKTASALPLEKTRVNAHITGLISTVTVIQSFSNPFELPIELEYLFPLPENATLVDFFIQIGPRIVHGDIRELEQAQEAYEKARQDGRQAAILDQRRPNLFAIQLANVLPSHPIQVSISYENTLTINADELEFVFPMGLTPKYHRQVQSTESKGVDSPIVSPGEKIGTIEIDVIASLGSCAGEPSSPSHQLAVEIPGDGQFTVTLKGAYIPDHDFILHFPLVERTIEPAVWCSKDTNGEIALINWLPITDETLQASTLPREFVFVLDRSGSMSGEPIRQARNALCACLRILEPGDTFRILLFDDRLEWYTGNAVQVSQTEIDRADLFLNGIEGRGGTEIIQAVENALNLPSDHERVRYILFLTDGAVSAEEHALQSIRKGLKQARIFTFGIGPSVNRALLSKMAQLGRGTAEFLQLNEDIEGAILRFQDKVAFPALTDINLEWAGCKSWDMLPAQLPDLYDGQNLQVVTRLKRNSGDQPASLRVTGVRGQEKIAIDVAIPASETDLPEIHRAWARARIDALLEQSYSGEALPHKIRQEVIGLAMEYHLVTPFTAFVALDPEVVNPNGEMLAIAVAQPLPAGLARGGFFPPSPAQITRTTFAMPSMPKFPRAFQRKNSSSAHESAVENELYQNHLTPSSDFVLSPANHPSSSPTPGFPMIPADSPEKQSADRADILRWLARTQNLNGSWSDDVEFTAAALLAFARQGHTTHGGYFRKQVRRAAEWLIQKSCDSTQENLRALALYELAAADPRLESGPHIKTMLSQLAPAKSPLEQIIQTLILHPEVPIIEPQRITDFDSLRIACILKLSLEVPAELLTTDRQHLTRVWMAGLLK